MAFVSAAGQCDGPGRRAGGERYHLDASGRHRVRARGCAGPGCGFRSGGIVGGKAADGISRQPEMEGKIRTTLMLDLVFIETAIIYALLVVILVIFVL